MKNATKFVATLIIVIAASISAFAQFRWNTQPAGPAKKVDVAVIKRDANGATYFDGTTETIGLYAKNGSLPNDVESLNEQMFTDGMCIAGTPAQQTACRWNVSYQTGTFVLTRTSDVVIKPVDGTKKIARIYFSFHFTDGLPEGFASIDKIGSGVRGNVNVIHFGSEQMFNGWGKLVNGERHWGTQMVTKQLTVAMFTYGTLPINKPIVAGETFYMNGNHDNSSPVAYKTPHAFQSAMWFSQIMPNDMESDRIELCAKVGAGMYTGKMKIHIHGVEFAQ